MLSLRRHDRSALIGAITKFALKAYLGRMRRRCRSIVMRKLCPSILIGMAGWLLCQPLVGVLAQETGAIASRTTNRTGLAAPVSASAIGDPSANRGDRHKQLTAQTKSLGPLRDPTQTVDRKAIRDFVLFNYAHVADDIINGKGIYLDTLSGLLAIEDNRKEAWRTGLITILLEKTVILEFSNCVARYPCDD